MSSVRSLMSVSLACAATVAASVASAGALLATQSERLATDASSVSQGALLNKPGDLFGGAQLVAAKGSSSATIKLAKVTSQIDQNGTASFDSWSLGGSAPLDKSGGDSTVANLDGLASAASIEFGYSSLSTHAVRKGKYIMSRLYILDPICLRAYEARKAKDGTDVPVKMDGCDQNLVDTYGTAEDKRTYEESFWDLDNASRWLWGTTAKIGYQTYEYVTASRFTKQKTSGKPWSVGLWGGVQPGDQELLLTLSAQYQRAFKEGDPATVCPVAAPTATSTICIAGPLEAPKEVRKKLLTGEVRARISGIGVALSATRDFSAKVTGIELPVYLWPDKDGKLTAGMKAGWRSDKRETTVGVFIGAPFGIFK